MRGALCRLLGIVLAALTLSLAATGTSRAGLLQCFEVLSPDKAIEATEIAAAAGACTTAAAGDPLMAVTIAAITAGAIAGAYSTSGDCKSKINGVVGVLIAEAILAAPPTRALLTDAQQDWLRQFIAGNQAVSFTEILNQIPALSVLNLYIECGCRVAGLPADLKRIAEKYASAAKSCANFAEDAIGAIGDTFASGGEAIHQALHGPPLTPGIQMETSCPRYYVPVGYWKKGKIRTHQEYDERGMSICGRTVCADNALVLERTGAQGETESTCVPACPKVLRTFTSGSQCYYEDIYSAREGRCISEASGQCCPPGQAVFEWGACSPACKRGHEIYDEDEGRCVACPGGQYPIYEASDSSIGSCRQCPFGHIYDVRAARCACPAGKVVREFTMPLFDMESGAALDTGITYKYCDDDAGCGLSCDENGDCTPVNAVRNRSGTCEPCPKGSFAHRGECVLTGDLHARFGGDVVMPEPACPAGQEWDGKRCVSRCATNERFSARLGRCIAAVVTPQPIVPRQPPPELVQPSPVPPGPFPPGPGDPQPLNPGMIFPGIVPPMPGSQQTFGPPAGTDTPRPGPQFQMAPMQQFDQAPTFQQMAPR